MLYNVVLVSDVQQQTVVHQSRLSMGFSRQEYWSGLPFPSPGVLPDPEVKPGSPALQVDSLPTEPPGKPQYNPGCMRYAWRGFMNSMVNFTKIDIRVYLLTL